MFHGEKENSINDKKTQNAWFRVCESRSNNKPHKNPGVLRSYRRKGLAEMETPNKERPWYITGPSSFPMQWTSGVLWQSRLGVLALTPSNWQDICHLPCCCQEWWPQISLLTSFLLAKKVQRNCPQRQTREAKVQGWLALKSPEEVKHPTNFANLQ